VNECPVSKLRDGGSLQRLQSATEVARAWKEVFRVQVDKRRRKIDNYKSRVGQIDRQQVDCQLFVIV